MSDTTVWNSSPLDVPLSVKEVHVWRVSLDFSATEIQQSREILSPDETSRADRFYFERDRHAFIAARGTLRQLLARYLGRPPAELAFAYGAYGKPSLREDFA